MERAPLLVTAALALHLAFLDHPQLMPEAAVVERGQIPQPPVALAALVVAEMELMLLELPVQRIQAVAEAVLGLALALPLMLAQQAAPAS
jgi:hypothetical protein